jgi:hypothetical protein
MSCKKLKVIGIIGIIGILIPYLYRSIKPIAEWVMEPPEFSVKPLSP